MIRYFTLAEKSNLCCLNIFFKFSALISAPDMQGLTRMYEPDYDLLLEETEKNIKDGSALFATGFIAEKGDRMP